MGNLWMNVTCSLVAVMAVLFALKPGGVWEFAKVANRLKPSSASLWNLRWKGEAEDCTCQTKEIPDDGVGSCMLKGTVSDCCCDYATVNHLNQYHLHPLVSQLVTLPFFRYFKVNLWCDCPFWPDNGMCASQSCSVCECEESEVPSIWRKEEKKPALSSCKEGKKHNGDGEFLVDRALEPEVERKLLNLPGWRGFNNPWMSEDENEKDYSYINLLKNIERYTGYKGEDAQRVWTAIYSQGCFADSPNPGQEQCEEKRVFYRLISGLHSSITAHIAKNYLNDEVSDVWGPNLDLFEWKLGSPELKSRVENLYFAFSFVLRAVMRSKPLIESIKYDTGSPKDDETTFKLINRLVNHPALQKACPVPFDEGRLWKGDQGPELKEQLQTSFRNITRIMDCVSCEKCRLWGKLQTLGIATALKVLFHEEDCSDMENDENSSTLVLERNEVIALINLLERLSQSVETYRVMSIMLEEKKESESGTGTSPPDTI